jgi:hypothetical protein
VIDRRERALRRTHLPASLAQFGERLRTRHFVDEVEADVELGLAVGEHAHGVRVPDFLKEGSSHG